MIDFKTALILNGSILVLFIAIMIYFVVKKIKKSKQAEKDLQKSLDLEVFSKDIAEKYSPEAVRARINDLKDGKQVNESVYIEPQREKMKRLAEENKLELKE